MKIIFSITMDQFNRFKSFVQKNIDSDYYTINRNAIKIKGCVQPSPSGKRYYERMKARQASFNQHCWVDNKQRFHIRRGFINNIKKDIYSYATNSGSAWGVYLEDKKPYLFFIGADSMLMRLPFLSDLVKNKAQPIIFENEHNKTTGKPWYEIGFVPQMLDMSKAIALFKGRDFNEELNYPEQFVWDKWVKNQDFIVAVMRK